MATRNTSYAGASTTQKDSEALESASKDTHSVSKRYDCLDSQVLLMTYLSLGHDFRATQDRYASLYLLLHSNPPPPRYAPIGGRYKPRTGRVVK